jgi:hypothetical protein
VSSKREIKNSPFIQIGATIKNMFGNLFKAHEKLNKSYEEPDVTSSNKGDGNIIIEESEKKTLRSKSIHHSKQQNG